MPEGILAGRTVIVTGAGQGLGRAHALELGRLGANVVVNDMDSRAGAVVDEITSAGGAGVECLANVADWTDSLRLVDFAISTFGRLDGLVNNAGIVRDRMLVTMSEEEWDQVITVDLKGHFCPLRHAAAYWREASKGPSPVQARVVNTTSGAGLMGSIGQVNYAAAKAGVAALTIQAAAELSRYGVTVNAIAPAARTSMTEIAFADDMRAPETGFDAMDPANVSPLVGWLLSEDSGDVTGRVFEMSGGAVSVCDGWQHGQPHDIKQRWDADRLGQAVRELIRSAPDPAPVYGA